jgi:hypothetical protein
MPKHAGDDDVSDIACGILTDNFAPYRLHISRPFFIQ